MKRPELTLLVVFFAFVNLSARAQNQNPHFKMLGENSKLIEINEFIETPKEIYPFGKNINRIYGMALNAELSVLDPSRDYSVNVIVFDEYGEPHRMYQCNNLMETSAHIKIEDYAEETCILNGIRPDYLQIEIVNATLDIESIAYTTGVKAGWDIEEIWQEKKHHQDADKIAKINKALKQGGRHWVAGHTAVSQMSYAERKKLYGQSTFPAGFEFYIGGVISVGESTAGSSLKSATTASPYIDEWDWRDRHGKNWITSIKNQEFCGSCWAFSVVGALEAAANLYFNQSLNFDMSEQDLVSCSNAGSCAGGYPMFASEYLLSTGVVDEAAFPYANYNAPCEEKTAPNDFLKIGGYEEIGWSEVYPTKSEDAIKSMLINMGALSSSVVDWSHAMVLVGWKVVKEGDVFFYRDLNLDRYWKTVEAGDPLIGKTVWIYKNSWGGSFGDNGYVYIESAIDNIQATIGFETPIISTINSYDVVCTDADGDGYYWWGLGEKPANCPPCPDLPDGDDSDPGKGPLDQYGYCMPLGPVAIPVAGFSASASTIEEGETITFSDVSTNTPTSWSWTFAGGNPSTSTAQNQTVTYDTPGTFTVSLTATNSAGSDIETKTEYITVNRIKTPPIADFEAISTTIKEGQSVSFTDLSTNTPTSWAWTFNGGTPGNSTAQNPTITYNTPGTYSVTLTASNNDGDDTKTATGYITVIEKTPPVVNFIANQTSLEEGNTVQFTDLSTNDPYAWQWEFPGGTTNNANEQNPSVIYSTVGTYNVTLTATNTDGSNQLTKTGFITVSEQQQTVVLNPPVAGFSYSTNSIETGQSVSFTDQSSNSPTKWTWTFSGNEVYTSTVQNPVITFNSADVYDVTLIAGNDDGSDTTIIKSCIQVSDPIPPPVADFSADITSIVEGDSIHFTDKSFNNPETWYWEFDGGTPATSTERNPKVTYHNPNSYKVSLTVTNKGGNDKKIVENYVKVDKAQPEYCIPSPLASDEWIKSVRIGSYEHASVKEGYGDFTATTFTLESGASYSVALTPEFSGRSKFEYWAVWIDYDQDMVFADSEKVFSASKSKSSVSGSFSIAEGFEMTTRMRVAMGKSEPTACGSSDLGEIEDYTVQITTPQPDPPVADFAANLYSINAGESIQFSDLSANKPDTYFWSFPGAEDTTSTLQNPTVTYPEAGVYDVSLTVGKAGFEPSTLTKEGLIIVNETGAVTYCVPTAINSSLNYISQVNIENGLTVNSSGEKYSLSGAVINLFPGASYKVQLLPSLSSSRNFWRIWIDFNNDGDFDDADETILAENNNKGGLNSNITIPAYASGDVRMRITMKTGKSPAACDDGFEGEVEDYTVSFGGVSAAEGQKMATGSSPFEEANDPFLKVYPNPTEQHVYIKLSVIGLDDTYAVYNATGSKIMENDITAPLSKVDLSMQPSGLYIVVINSQRNSYTKKIIKK